MTNEEMIEEIKRHNSVLQEQFVKEVKTVAEGHDIIRREMKEGFSELKSEIREVASIVERHENKISHL